MSVVSSNPTNIHGLAGMEFWVPGGHYDGCKGLFGRERGVVGKWDSRLGQRFNWIDTVVREIHALGRLQIHVYFDCHPLRGFVGLAWNKGAGYTLMYVGYLPFLYFVYCSMFPGRMVFGSKCLLVAPLFASFFFKLLFGWSRSS